MVSLLGSSSSAVIIRPLEEGDMINSYVLQELEEGRIGHLLPSN
jgi:hypothetical protein